MGDRPRGFGNPPKQFSYKPKQSGNPRGRPRGPNKKTIHDRVLTEPVNIVGKDVSRKITVEEALLIQVARSASSGNVGAIDDLEYVDKIVAVTQMHTVVEPIGWTRIIVTPGSPNPALLRLKMATMLDQYTKNAQMRLEPWLVEAALARLGANSLTVEQQATVVAATRVAWNVRWPDWWTVRPAR